MYSPSLLSLEVKVTNWKVSGGTQLPGGKYKPVTSVLTNLQAVNLCLRPVRMLHSTRHIHLCNPDSDLDCLDQLDL